MSNSLYYSRDGGSTWLTHAATNLNPRAGCVLASSGSRLFLYAGQDSNGQPDAATQTSLVPPHA